MGSKNKIMKEKSKEQQTLFREKQVHNLTDIIYGKKQEKSFGYFEDQVPASTSGETDFIEEVELSTDCYRFDVHSFKLERYKKRSVKRLLKKKFVTGLAKDKVMENILNMSDSDEEGKDKKGNTIGK